MSARGQPRERWGPVLRNERLWSAGETGRGLPLTPSCPTRNWGPRAERTGPSPARWAGQSLLGRPSSCEPKHPPRCHGNSFLAQQALASSRTALPPADHVLPTPDLGTAGLGVRKARACVTQASPGVPRPHSASLPLLCLSDSCLAAFPVYDSGP